MKKIMYADTINGKFDMSWEDVVLTCQENPSSSKDEKIVFDEEGSGFSLQDIAEIEKTEIVGNLDDEGYYLAR